MKPCDDSRRVTLPAPFRSRRSARKRSCSAGLRDSSSHDSRDRQVSHPVAPSPIKKEARCADEPPADAAGYAYIYQPEASPIARRARYNHLTLAAPKSCAQESKARPAGKLPGTATALPSPTRRTATFIPPHTLNFRVPPINISSYAPVPLDADIEICKLRFRPWRPCPTRSTRLCRTSSSRSAKPRFSIRVPPAPGR